jgi:hypothetical protein
MSDRGMKKWAPFASLIEQSICLEEMKFAKNKIEKPKISNEIAEKINAILTHYQGQEVTITYYYDGYIYKVKDIIKSINQYNRKIILSSGSIPLSEVLDIEDENFSNNIDFA